MDPVGVGLGVASLAFELFSGCVKGYNLILTAKDMPKACRHLLVRLQMEKEKLLGWAVLANVSESDESPSSTLQLNRHTIHDALREMQVLLLDVKKLKDRYSLELVVAEDKPEQENRDSSADRKLPDGYASLEKQTLRFFEKTRKCPKRLRWASFDKEKFERMLSDVTALNGSMMHFLNSHELDRHYQLQEVTFLQVLEMSDRMDDLAGLLEAVQPGHRAMSGRGSDGRGQKYRERAARLTRFKVANLRIENDKGHGVQGGTKLTTCAEIKYSDLELLSLPDATSDDRPERSCGRLKGQTVWVEWRYYEPMCGYDKNGNEIVYAPTTVTNRISGIAQLLCETDKPPEFHIPDCVGYAHDSHESRMGFVFKLSLSTEPALPVSLLQHLGSLRKPSLTVRIRMANVVSSSIWYLHATQWLHKGLRSENIVFESTKDGGPLSAPKLCGFDYSRPVGLDETTEEPTQDPWHNLYRHPKTQFDVPREGKRGFRKLYDIYSLGVVLFEIGTWQPVHTILGMGTDVSRPRTAAVKGVRERLTSRDMLELLEAEAGSLFAAAVKFCLTGGSPGLALDEGELDDATLRYQVWEQVLSRLKDINI